MDYLWDVKRMDDVAFCPVTPACPAQRLRRVTGPKPVRRLSIHGHAVRQ